MLTFWKNCSIVLFLKLEKGIQTINLLLPQIPTSPLSPSILASSEASVHLFVIHAGHFDVCAFVTVVGHFVVGACLFVIYASLFVKDVGLFVTSVGVSVVDVRHFVVDVGLFVLCVSLFVTHVNLFVLHEIFL